jgi:SPP1 gp7 family putative phage head morphogenesis protein
VSDPIPGRPPPDPLAFHEAVGWFRQRVPMSEDDFDAVVDRSYEHAVKVAGVNQLQVVTSVWEALDEAIAQGETLDSFANRVEADLTAEWGEARPWRLETIYRTNLQHAYSRGRWEQQTDPAVQALRPFWEFSAIMDSRTSPVCRPLDGTILAADHPFWQTHNPPLHHNCRSTVISLTEEQAKERGITPEPPGAAPAAGFGSAPGDDAWRPDLSTYPRELTEIALQKLAR